MAETYRGRARLRAGARASDVQFHNVGYADWALESYALFARLKSEGVLPTNVRFQVCIPDPAIIVNLHVLPQAKDDVGPIYTEGLFAEIERMASTIPASEFAIQWDCTQPVEYETADAARRQSIIQEIVAARRLRAEWSPLGYHLCYGDFRAQARTATAQSGGVRRDCQRHHRDRVPAVGLGAHAGAGRPRRHAYVAPLADLRLSGDTRLYLGLVHYSDGVAGTRRRIATAASVYPDFGIATECGMGRRVGQDIHELLRIHAEAAGELSEV